MQSRPGPVTRSSAITGAGGGALQTTAAALQRCSRPAAWMPALRTAALCVALVILPVLAPASAAITDTASAAVSKPQLSGIFVDLTPTTRAWSQAQWTTDLRSMAAAGIEFLVVHHSAVGDANVSAACPAGRYEAYFEVSAECFRQAADNASVGSGGSLGAILHAARTVGLRIHLGLAEQEELGPTVDGKRRNPLYGRYANTTAVQNFQQAQATLAHALWSRFGDTGLIDGFYVFLEEPQNFASSLPDWERLATHYFQPLARYIKHSLKPINEHDPGDLAVWSSPDAVGNYTRYYELQYKFH